MWMSESDRKKAPTVDDYIETLRVLWDFGDYVSADDLPEFSAKWQLEQWQRARIAASFAQ